MSMKYIDLVSNTLTQEIILAQEGIKKNLLDKDLDPKVKMEKILQSLEEYKQASLSLNFWEDYINKNVAKPQMNNETQMGDN